MRPVERVIEAVDGYEERANGFWCVCPAHDDHEPSLHVEESEDGKVLFVCRAGCKQAAVLAALEHRGVRKRDLFPGNGSGYVSVPSRNGRDSREGRPEPLRGSQDGRERLVEAYFIKDPSGRLVAVHERYEGPAGKRFLWKHPDGQYSKGGEIRPATLPPYGSEHVEDWPEEHGIVLAEGEKPVDALRERGIRALGTVTGAKGTHDPESLEVLAGRRVVLWPDYDLAGREHMRRIAKRLAEIAAEVHWYEWQGAPEKGDAADHPAIASGDEKGLKELARQLRDAPAWDMEGAPLAEQQSSSFKESRSDVSFSSAAELIRKEIEPVRWVVPGILPEGVALLAAKPKIGKSWLALGLCVVSAAGGHALGNVPVERGAALYLALEDNERRLQSRLRKVLNDGEVPSGLYYATHCPRLDDGGTEAIEGWLETHPDARLVILDTMAKIRPRASGKNVYQEDYEALEELLPLAAGHNVAIVVVHHLRKQGAADPLDELNSSTGLTAGVDGILILKRDRTRADASLFVTGRDVEEEKDFALRWSADVGAWTLAGDAEEYRIAVGRSSTMHAKHTGLSGPKRFRRRLGRTTRRRRSLCARCLRLAPLPTQVTASTKPQTLNPR